MRGVGKRLTIVLLVCLLGVFARPILGKGDSRGKWDDESMAGEVWKLVENLQAEQEERLE